jgi:HK97 gp10 family phage protein
VRLGITVTGGAELVRKLERLSANTAGQMLEAAVVSGALLVANDAKRRAPYKTGNLRRSIHVGGHATESLGEGTDIGGNKHDAHSAEVLVGTNVVYAAIQEYGGRGITGRGYLRGAFDENKEAVTKEIKDALSDLLAKI